MKTLLLIKGWDRIRTSFWFVPSMMLAGAVALFIVTISIDYRLSRSWSDSVWYVYAGGATGAQSLLSTVAGSMITVTGVVFSITIVAFTLASSQFSPRLLRNYMRDPGNQLTLGTFIATFIYCLLVLRTVRGTDENEFVPHASVTCAVLLTIGSIGVLIYYIHHASSVIQAQHVVAALGKALEGGVDRIFPSGLGEEGRAELTPQEAEWVEQSRRDGDVVEAPRSDYIQGIDGDRLIELAREHDVLVEALCRPGHYVSQGEAIARVMPSGKMPDPEGIAEAFVVGGHRTDVQDFEFTINELVEVALRALSPSLNDPFTAIACINRLESVLIRLARTELARCYRYDGERRLRLIMVPMGFSSLLNAAFHQIRQSSRGHAAVLIRLLEALGSVGAAAQREEDAEAIARHAAMVLRNVEASVPEKEDRMDALERFKRVERALDGKRGAATDAPAGPDKL